MNKDQLLAKFGALEVVKAKLLTKLAQLQHVSNPAPQKVDPKPVAIDEPTRILNSLYARFPSVRSAVRSVLISGSQDPSKGTVTVNFFPGKASQASLNAVTRVIEDLTKKNLLNFPGYDIVQGAS